MEAVSQNVCHIPLYKLKSSCSKGFLGHIVIVRNRLKT